MPCLSPKIIINPHYIKLCNISINSRDQTKMFAHRLYGTRPDFLITIPCGRCRSCMRKRAFDWLYRLSCEHYHALDLGFQPMTLDLDVAPEYYDDLCKNPSIYLRRFTDLVRKTIGKSMRYMFISEYGKKHGRWHLHGMVFNLQPSEMSFVLGCWRYGRSVSKVIYSIGGYDYRVKYIFKDFFDGRRDFFRKKFTPTEYAARPGRVWCSPGIGLGYFTPEVIKSLRCNDYITAIVRDYKGRTRYLPRYFRDKVFSDEERYTLKRVFQFESVQHPFSCGYRLFLNDYHNYSNYASVRERFSLPRYPIRPEYLDTAPDFLYDYFSYHTDKDNAENLLTYLLNQNQN